MRPWHDPEIEPSYYIWAQRRTISESPLSPMFKARLILYNMILFAQLPAIKVYWHKHLIVWQSVNCECPCYKYPIHMKYCSYYLITHCVCLRRNVPFTSVKKDIFSWVSYLSALPLFCGHQVKSCFHYFMVDFQINLQWPSVAHWAAPPGIVRSKNHK